MCILALWTKNMILLLYISGLGIFNFSWGKEYSLKRDVKRKRNCLEKDKKHGLNLFPLIFVRLTAGHFFFFFKKKRLLLKRKKKKENQ